MTLQPTDMTTSARAADLIVVMRIKPELARDIDVLVGDELGFRITREEMLDGLAVELFAQRLRSMLVTVRNVEYVRTAV